MPTTFAATMKAQGITPRRLALELTLGDARSTASPRVPVACYLFPGTETTTEVTELGKFEVDLGKAVMALGTVWPGLPDVLTFKTGGSLDIKRVRAKVQATGKGKRKCRWLIADSEMIYGFNPSCIVQAPRKTRLSIEARLHVQARTCHPARPCQPRSWPPASSTMKSL